MFSGTAHLEEVCRRLLYEFANKEKSSSLRQKHDDDHYFMKPASGNDNRRVKLNALNALLIFQATSPLGNWLCY